MEFFHSMEEANSLRLLWRGFKNRHVKQVDYNYIILNNMTSIARLSFIAHSSINHLDLSIRETPKKTRSRHDFTSCNRLIITEEDCKKAMIPKRRLLYTLHLDLPKKLDMRLRLEPAHAFRSKVSYGDNTFHLRDIFIDEKAYLEILRQFLTESIENSSKKVALIGKYINTIKQYFGDLESFLSERYSWLLYIIYYECNDSQIVKEVLSAFDFPMWVFYSDDCDSEILDFFLYHARLSKCNVWKNYTRGDPIIGCFLHKKYDFVAILLKYINAPCFMELDYSFNTLQRKSKLLTRNIRNAILIDYIYRDQPARERRKSTQRNFLALMILDLFENLPSDEGVLALRLLWRAIADSFFTLSEWMLAFGNQLDPEILQQVDKFYSEIIEEDTSLRSPRTLQQHCRVTIRKTLYDCQKLPNGIELLNLDSRSKAFLRLEN